MSAAADAMQRCLLALHAQQADTHHSSDPGATAQVALIEQELSRLRAVSVGPYAAALVDHYTVLGVGQQAGGQEVRAAYRRLALKWHPVSMGCMRAHVHALHIPMHWFYGWLKVSIARAATGWFKMPVAVLLLGASNMGEASPASVRLAMSWALLAGSLHPRLAKELVQSSIVGGPCQYHVVMNVHADATATCWSS